jgi:hypothetical protein
LVLLACAAGARGTARTHLPTDEASLKQLQLATGHELPGLVLEYRCGCRGDPTASVVASSPTYPKQTVLQIDALQGHEMPGLVLRYSCAGGGFTMLKKHSSESALPQAVKCSTVKLTTSACTPATPASLQDPFAACCCASNACRSKQNAVSKYFDADWVQRAARQGAAQAAAAGGGQVVVDLHCCWNQTNTATGRLSSCSPNLQVGQH